MAVKIDTKKEILKKVEAGEQIQKLAMEYSISRKTIYHWMKFGVENNYHRIKKINTRDEKLIVKLKKSDPQITYEKIKTKIKNKISFKNIYKALLKASLTNFKNIRTISLKNYNKFLSLDVSVLENIYNKMAKGKKKSDLYETHYCFFKLLYEKGENCKAIEYGKKLHKNKSNAIKALHDKDNYFEGNLYFILGNCYRTVGNYSKSSYFYSKASVCLEGYNPSLITEMFIKSITAILFSVVDKEAKNFIKIIDKSISDTNDVLIKQRAYSTLALYYFKTKNYPLAAENYENVIKLGLENDLNLAKMYYSLGLSYKNTKEYDKAIESLDKSLHFSSNNLLQQGKIYITEAFILFKQHKNKDNAEKLFLKAKNIFFKLGNKNQYIFVMYHLATFYKYYNKHKAYEKVILDISALLNSDVKEIAEKYLIKLEECEL
ncbi:MAG: hypothetical protein JXR48_15050 [Candidatus Delongbacteria bacterium]|nr:hypothetical protein [Candidatus Delongbacteria bacterium]MBN2836274.1 hypothetical protein [Candidatus Delongbacteria bacterium]